MDVRLCAFSDVLAGPAHNGGRPRRHCLCRPSDQGRRLRRRSRCAALHRHAAPRRRCCDAAPRQMYIQSIHESPDRSRQIPRRRRPLRTSGRFLTACWPCCCRPGGGLVRLARHALAHRPRRGPLCQHRLGDVRSGDWVTPRLNGLLYFEKPPMQYWLSALFLHLFGLNEFAARLWPALAGFLTAFAVGATAWRLWGRETGIRSLAVAASMTWIFGNAHFLTLDAGLTLFLTIALCAVADRRERSGRDRRAPQLDLARLGRDGRRGAQQGAGRHRDSRRDAGPDLPVAPGLRSLAPDALGLGPADLPAAGGAMVRAGVDAQPELRPVLLHPRAFRALPDQGPPAPRRLVVLPAAAARRGCCPGPAPCRGCGPRRAADAPPRGFAPADFLFVHSAFILLFFSASGSKLPSYILPMFPALALLIGLRLQQASPRVLRRHLLVPIARLVGGAGRLDAERADGRRFDAGRGRSPSWAPAIRWGAAVFLAVRGVRMVGPAAARRDAGRVGLALGHLIGITIVMAAHEPSASSRARRPSCRR